MGFCSRNLCSAHTVHMYIQSQQKKNMKLLSVYGGYYSRYAVLIFPFVYVSHIHVIKFELYGISKIPQNCLSVIYVLNLSHSVFKIKLTFPAFISVSFKTLELTYMLQQTKAKTNNCRNFMFTNSVESCSRRIQTDNFDHLEYILYSTVKLRLI